MPDSHSGAFDRTVFFISDGTGITAETLGHSVLTQFGGLRALSDVEIKQVATYVHSLGGGQ